MARNAEDPSMSTDAIKKKRVESEEYAVVCAEDLDCRQRNGCENDGCGCTAKPMYFSSKCHPGSRLAAWYDNAILTLACGECHSPLLQFVVAHWIDLFALRYVDHDRLAAADLTEIEDQGPQA